MDQRYTNGGNSSHLPALAKSPKMLTLAIFLSASALFSFISLLQSGLVTAMTNLISLGMSVVMCVGAWLTYTSVNPSGVAMMFVIQKIKHILALIGFIAFIVFVVLAIILLAAAEADFGIILLVVLALGLYDAYFIVQWKFYKQSSILLQDASNALRTNSRPTCYGGTLSGLAFTLGIISSIVAFFIFLIVVAFGSYINELRYLIDFSALRDLLDIFSPLTLISSLLAPATYFLVFVMAKEY